ncbi:unnamed protein product [Arctia plantaginis]|uniref:Carboxylesterase type B domain-containing protein n=1 Tax=Arctia plantaginis TaxID=874455 RepID=A0A8S1A565_ARCPL|nr:unnamed protein product [Arctia plantaginis]
MVFKTFIIAAILQVVTGRTRIGPLVNTDAGLIKGLQADDGDYSMFLGIPFGKVDEANPFSAATPYPKFDNTFEAFNDTTVCPQVQEPQGTVAGTPDCLVLNVYVPFSASSSNRLPVLVWIFGGGLMYGDDKPVTPEDQVIINQMTTMWANFVKLGTPVPQTSDLLQIQWTPINNQSQRPYLNIDLQLSLGSRPFHQRATFWDLFYRANDHFLKANNPAEI